MTDNLVFPCFCCLLIGFLGGFAAGFRLAAAVRLGQQQPPSSTTPELAQDFA